MVYEVQTVTSLLSPMLPPTALTELLNLNFQYLNHQNNHSAELTVEFRKLFRSCFFYLAARLS